MSHGALTGGTSTEDCEARDEALAAWVMTAAAPALRRKPLLLIFIEGKFIDLLVSFCHICFGFVTYVRMVAEQASLSLTFAIAMSIQVEQKIETMGYA